MKVDIIQQYAEDVYKITEPVNGSWVQAICYDLGVFEPIGNNWEQTLASIVGITEPVNGTYIQAIAEDYGYTEPINGSWWLPFLLDKKVIGIPTTHEWNGVTYTTYNGGKTYDKYLTIPNDNTILRQTINDICTVLGWDISLNWLDVSNQTSFWFLFRGYTEDGIDNRDFSGDISRWNASNVTDMSSMCEGAASFNSDLSRWDVSNVKYMPSMFYGAASFNSDLSRWDVSNVKYMGAMLPWTFSFNNNGAPLTWNVQSLLDNQFMVYDSGVSIIAFKNAGKIEIQDMYSFAGTLGVLEYLLLEDFNIYHEYVDFLSLDLSLYNLATKKGLLDLCNGAKFNGVYYGGVRDMTGQIANTITLHTATLDANEQAEVESAFNAKNWIVVWTN